MSIEAMKQALEALEVASSCVDGYYIPIGKSHLPEVEQAITVIKEALAQPEQELTTTLKASVHAGLDKKNDKNPQVDHQGKQPEQEPIGTVKELFTLDAWERLDLRGSTQVYTTPPQRTWVGLTDEDEIAWEEGGSLKDLVKAIEAKLKEKNNG